MSEIPVYGDGLYTKDSGICKSAFHSKKIPATGGLVTMVIKKGSTNYKGSDSNGVKSEGKYKSPMSVSFEMYEEEDVIIVKPGTKIDLKLDTPAGEKWFPAIILTVLDIPNGRFLKMNLDGENSKTIELPYPNKDKIHPCREHVKNDRDCKGSLKRLKTKLPVLIRFVPYGYETNDCRC